MYIRYSGSRRSRSQVWRKLEDIIRRDNQRSREVLAGDLIGIGPSIVPAIREARLEEGGPNVGECPWGCPSQCWGNQDTELKLYIFISVLEWGYGGWAERRTSVNCPEESDQEAPVWGPKGTGATLETASVIKENKMVVI